MARCCRAWRGERRALRRTLERRRHPRAARRAGDTAEETMKPNDLDPGVHGGRRARLALAMQAGVAVVPTSPERIRNRDTHYPYRFDSHFYYLTGFPEPEAVLVIVGGT